MHRCHETALRATDRENKHEDSGEKEHGIQAFSPLLSRHRFCHQIKSTLKKKKRTVAALVVGLRVRHGVVGVVVVVNLLLFSGGGLG